MALYEQEHLRRRRFLAAMGGSLGTGNGLGKKVARDLFHRVQPHVELIAHRPHRFQPEQRHPSTERVRELQRPAGFRINTFVRDLDNPRMLALGPDGTVYVTLTRPGEVVALQDSDGDGRADRRRVVVSGLPEVHGICIHDEQMYLATVEKVFVCRLHDEKVGPPQLLLDRLPFAGRHPSRTIAFGPDEHLYVSVGGSGNCCKESNPEHAAILRVSPNGTQRSIFARGLRSTIGFAWHPLTEVMWGMDHGSDGLGDNLPPEKLNRLEEGKDYGWPYVYGDRQTISTSAVKPEVVQAYARTTIPPVLCYQAHAVPMGMVFYTGRQFPTQYHNDAFVAMHGSSSRDPAVGYEVVRVKFDRRGNPVEFQRFVTGFLIEGGRAFFARPAGLLVTQDGSLLVSDDVNGVIYRVSYRGK